MKQLNRSNKEVNESAGERVARADKATTIIPITPGASGNPRISKKFQSMRLDIQHWSCKESKAFSWRITGTIDTTIVSFIISGKLKVAFTIGFIELFTKISLYYIHERIWNKLKFGWLSIKDEDYQI